MKCPVCSNVDLLMAERHGVEIDYCPTCRGVWLDRGELDKVIERANAQSYELASTRKEAPLRPTEPSAPRIEQEQRFGKGYQERGYGHGHQYKKKKSLLAEIFDFD